MSVVIQVENLSKYYRLGLIGGGTLREDLNRWWAMKVRGRPDPLLKIGDTDHGNRVGGELWALRDVSFQVREGEILGIIGRNGAGKSTLLKILSRITAPTSGQVKIKGRVGSLLEVGTGFHPELTGRENIYLNGAILGMKKAEIDRKLDEIIDFAEIEQFIDTPVKRYSSGMYVRLAFAVAAHLEPEILIVDEVLAVGDVMFQKKCLGKMGDVAKSGRTVLFVSHNLVAVDGLCTRCLLLEGGREIFDGNVQQGISKYEGETHRLLLDTLAARQDRAGSGKLKFTGYFFTNNDGIRIDELSLGQSASLHIEYETRTCLHGVNIAFNLYEKESDVLMNFNSSDIGKNFIITNKRGCFTCRIPFFPLRAGSYQGNLFCADSSGLLDWVRPGISVSVRDRDVFGTGKLISQGRFLTNYDWSVAERC